MNRKYRRKNKEQKRVAVYNMSYDQIEKIKEDATNEAVNRMIIFETYLTLMVLRDKYGFGRKRLAEFMDAHTELLDSLQKDYFSYTDLVDVIELETGYKYEFSEV